MPNKIKLPQPERYTERDNFRTPRYASELLVPFLKKSGFKTVWECASGSGNIARPLCDAGLSVYRTDIQPAPDTKTFNFLTEELDKTGLDCIVTNPPFSLKKKFVDRCFYYGIPWALLMPDDVSGWYIEAMKKGCQKITPEKRVDYLTPNMLGNINNEVLKEMCEKLSEKKFKSLKDVPLGLKEQADGQCESFNLYYEELESVPVWRLRKFTSNFHSTWLTWGFNLGAQIVFAPLTNAQKDRIF